MQIFCVKYIILATIFVIYARVALYVRRATTNSLIQDIFKCESNPSFSPFYCAYINFFL